MKLEAVIFDLDGTLIDSMGVWVEVDKEYLGKRGIPIPDDLFHDMEHGDSFVEVAKYFKQKFNLSDSIEEIMKEWTEMVARHYENDIPLKPGARELLDFLKAKKIKIGVGTSNSKFLAQSVLKANNVLHFFDCLVAGCEDIKGKPFPDIFLRVASELGVKPENCLVIEDVFVGIQAAKNAGMTVFSIEDKHTKPEWEKIKKITDFYGKDFWKIKEKIEKLL
ncbi:MAG: HAD family phosphatase [Candidatus Cloacimonetes bacterium]|nr:HAD family phosphatase [Candidatus Cloacimonadota bacterium]MCK4358729.1 HAD family phosphatase [Candidatus Cloacimonadota bacterium]